MNYALNMENFMKMPNVIRRISLLALVLGTYPTLEAAPVDKAEALTVVKTWLGVQPRPMGQKMALQTETATATTYADKEGNPLYHAVSLGNAGYVIVAGDDEIEPVIVFSPTGKYVEDPQSPMTALLRNDLPQRLRAAREIAPANWPAEMRQAKAKWAKLRQAASGGMSKASLFWTTDTRVDPFLSTLWDQVDVNDLACYNYYTPKTGDGSANNYPCGCVATAMAQVMYYHLYPTRAVGTAAYTVKVDGATKTLKMRGGNGSGGAYNWGAMLVDPANATLTTAACQAIGALTYDAGVASHMMYTASSSGAYLNDAQKALTGPFMYSNAIVATYINSDLPLSALTGMINPNLDAKYPVILGIIDANGENGHAVVADGYGFDNSTPYYHVNMGWSGQENAWYALPLIDSYWVNFTVVMNCVYNIFPTTKGEILSGRVVDNNGNPVNQATVTAVRGTETYTKTTDDYGVYAFAAIPSNARYAVTVTKDGYAKQTATFTIGTTSSESLKPGNVWGANFALSVEQTTPTAPFFPANAVTIANNQVSITFNGTVGSAYQVQESETLATWVTVKTGTITTTPATVTFDKATSNAKFYRLQTQ